MNSWHNKPLPPVPNDEDEPFKQQENNTSRHNKPLPPIPDPRIQLGVPDKNRIHEKVSSSGQPVSPPSVYKLERMTSFHEIPEPLPRNFFRPRSQSDININEKYGESEEEDYLRPTRDTLEHYDWFFNIERDEAESMLNEDGIFLVRPKSSGNPETPYTLCVYHKQVYHINIKHTSYGYQLGLAIKSHPSLKELIDYHRDNAIYLAGSSTNIILLRDTPRGVRKEINKQDFDYEDPNRLPCQKSIFNLERPLPTPPTLGHQEMIVEVDRNFPVPKPRPRVPIKSSPDSNKIESEAWYFDINRKLADTILTEDGHFLVRPSKTGGHSSPYVLCIFYDIRVYHLQIRQQCGFYALGTPRANEKIFNTIKEIISYHHAIPILLAGKEDETILLRKSPSRDGVYDRTA